MIGSRIIERSEAESSVRYAFCLMLEKHVKELGECKIILNQPAEYNDTALKNAKLTYEVAKELLEEFRSGGPKATAKPARGDE